MATMGGTYHVMLGIAPTTPLHLPPKNLGVRRRLLRIAPSVL